MVKEGLELDTPTLPITDEQLERLGLKLPLTPEQYNT